MPASPLTQAILDNAQRARSRGRDPLVVLDLDGTLYDNTVRTLRILQEFAHQHATEHPELLRAVAELPSGRLKYRMSDSLAQVGITDESLVAKVEAFWEKRFFTNEYVLYDLPTAGALDFVRLLYAGQVVPCYLTGRDAENMLIGTVQSLQRDGFPIGTIDTRVVLKADYRTQDHAYKESVIAQLRATSEVVGVFDNEPGLCNLFQRAFPEATVVNLDTGHSPNAPALADGIPRIPDFRPLTA